jgi:hypothetical protein
MIPCLFSFNVINVMNYINCFANVKANLHFYNKPNLVMIFYLFLYISEFGLLIF